jgi:hypothetical protein
MERCDVLEIFDLATLSWHCWDSDVEELMVKIFSEVMRNELSTKLHLDQQGPEAAVALEDQLSRSITPSNSESKPPTTDSVGRFSIAAMLFLSFSTARLAWVSQLSYFNSY